MSVTFILPCDKAQSEVTVEKDDFSSVCHSGLNRKFSPLGYLKSLAYHTPPENRKLWTPVERTDGPLSVLFVFSIFQMPLRNYFHILCKI